MGGAVSRMAWFKETGDESQRENNQSIDGEIMKYKPTKQMQKIAETLHTELQKSDIEMKVVNELIQKSLKLHSMMILKKYSVLDINDAVY
jgi:flagellar motor switch/type III secretory pathway protein FliN